MSVGIVPNTIDPVNTLQVQIYTVNAKQVSNLTSLTGLANQITALTAQIASETTAKNALQTQYNNFITYLSGKGVTDLTKPLTQAQIDAITADGFATTAV